MKEEEKLLVEQARDGYERAFSTLYNTYKKTVWYTAFKVVNNADAADDITSQVFTKVYLKLKSYTHHLSFEMWLKTITVNTAIDYIRRNKKEQLNNYVDEDENSIQLSTLERSPEEDLILKEKLDIVLQAIPTLKKKYRDLINARIDGMSYKEIANKLAMNELAVKGDLNKARQKLKQKTDY